ncbi:vacuolar protein sorting/targeting protein 10 [Coprinopsis sp. MPI-PUGE-AT-0042]|nr:vacuolar protein sorting/targeting protein 10 [Coprinopsis sp. MPI-PUGE-AT-0042]
MAGPTARGGFIFIWAFLLAIITLCAAQKPEHSISSFDNLPARLFFLDDTLNVIYHDALEGNVLVSNDEGKTWKPAEGLPKNKIAMVFEHPFDNHYAFALTDGKTHFRTEDRGKTWRSFETPSPPALTARPLSFHSDPKKYGYILFQGSDCEGSGWGRRCHDVTYYTKDAFSTKPKELLSYTNRCQFAHSSKDFKHEAHEDLVYCVSFDEKVEEGAHLHAARLFSSTDFFDKERKVEDLGMDAKSARGVVAFAIVSKYAVVAIKKPSSKEMELYVTLDAKNWAKAHFPHASSAKLRENAYTIVESTTHSLAVDVVLHDRQAIGTLFVSNSNGTYFVESLKDTNRNEMGFVDYERVYGVDGIGLANVVANAQEVEGRGSAKRLRSRITFDDGRSWQPLRAPLRDDEGNRAKCDPSDEDTCALHLHSVTTPHNYGRVFSSPAPGVVMGVGTVGESLVEYDDSDTFLSTDAGLSWKMVAKGAHKFRFGDQGSVLVIVDDEEYTSKIRYSVDMGKNWETYDFGVSIRSRALTSLPDSTSQKFLLLGQTSRDSDKKFGKVVVVHLDFSKMRKNKCGDSDFEKWYARPPGKKECLMGHKQWYKRRKEDANCYVGDKFHDPEEKEEVCECTKEDFECDYNYVRNGEKCEPVGLEPAPPNSCNEKTDTYMGSSGFRKVPGNTCKGGLDMDEPVEKSCDRAKPAEGTVVHQKFNFKSPIVQFAYFKGSSTILVRLLDHSIWQSSNEGYTWNQIQPGAKFLAFYHHKYVHERAYLLTDTKKVWYTTDTGRSWYAFDAPNPPNTFEARVLHFSPSNDDYIIWTGDAQCPGSKCHAEAHFSRVNGRSWTLVERYVRNCAFAEDAKLSADPSEIICESLKEKSGLQQTFGAQIQLVAGGNFYARQKKLFDSVVGFAKFSEFLVVAELDTKNKELDLQVSLDGVHFASGQFPASMSPSTHAYTVLESTTGALFLHMTMTPNPPPSPQWGNLLKSNSNGTYFGLSLENVNRNDRGYVDYEKLIGLDGIAIVNIVANTADARISGNKKLQTRITHNDGSTWKSVAPPLRDSLGNGYACSDTKCALHLHGYTARRDPRATYSSPSAPGVMMGVGNVGESLAPYMDSDTFLSRDGGFTWEEVHKDAHLWEFGDSGSLIVIVNDEEPTDHLMFTTDEGLSWREYKFSPREKVRISALTNVPSDTSRKFLLFGIVEGRGRETESVVFHVDFSSLTSRQCLLNHDEPVNDDFELWSPSEERNEECLFGRQTLYHRRVRDAQCYVGTLPKIDQSITKNCTCTMADFECEFNYVKNRNDECVLEEGTKPLASSFEDQCKGDADVWYERTAYRRIPYSSCEGGKRPDRGTEHPCPGFKSQGGWFWLFMLMVPFAFTALVGYYYWRRSGVARGTIRLPGGADTRGPLYGSSGSDWLDTLASVPVYLIGLGGIAFEWVASKVDASSDGWRARRGYRDIPVDEDAQVLRFEDEE